MLQKFKPAAWTAVTVLCFTATVCIAWQKTPGTVRGNHFPDDTLPKTEHAKSDETIINGDLDKAMQEVKKAQENLQRQLQHKDWEKMQQDMLKAESELNTVNIHRQLENAMKEIDLQKINVETQMKNLDLQKIQMETQAALQKVDWEKMQKDMDKAQAEIKNSIDSKKIEIDIQRSMEETKKAMAELKATSMEKIQQQLEKSTAELALNEDRMQENIERARKEITENVHRDFKKDIERAAAEVKRASAELQNYKDLLTEMAKDGLIHAEDSYNIEYKNGSLFIDGKKQPDNITSKYKHYFKKENVQLKRETGDEDNKTIHL